tara:strand:+ start:284 stop:1222 length:939 start_codon:yes stop_codon:yes gene_type:complete
MSNTIAFNNKKNIWTSKYSYTSSNYASLDKQFFSSRKRVEANDDTVCWEHNVNPTRNNFYGEQYKSAIAVSFNDNPSQNKLYKTFSVEGSENLQGSIHSFSTSETLQPQKTPLTVDVSTLKNKGGILYGNVPKDPRIKANVNMKFIGSTSRGTTTQALGQDLYFFNGVVGNTAFTLDQSTKFAFVFGNSISPVVIAPDGGSVSLQENTDFYTLNSGFLCPSSSELDLEGIDELSDKGIIFKATLGAYATFLSSLQNTDGIVSIFAITDPAINGDFLRGQYAEVAMTMASGSEPFELYSFNVNYEPTDLDHSK